MSSYERSYLYVDETGAPVHLTRELPPQNIEGRYVIALGPLDVVTYEKLGEALEVLASIPGQPLRFGLGLAAPAGAPPEYVDAYWFPGGNK